MFTFSGTTDISETRIKDLNKPKGKFPKSLIPFFCISQFIFGAEFGFAIHFDEKYRTFIKRFTFAVSLVMIIILLTPIKLAGDLWFWFNLSEYLFYFFATRLVKYSPCDLILAILDKGEDRIGNGLGITVFIYTATMMILKIVLGFLRCYNIYNEDGYCKYMSTIMYLLYHLPCLSLDLNPVIRIIICHCINRKVKQLKDKLKRSEISLSAFLQQYMEIADCYDNSKRLLGCFLIMELIAGVPKVMGESWYMLLLIKQNKHSWSTYACEFVYILHSILQILLPAIVAEMVTTQVDSIKMVLSERIATDADEKTTSQAGRILQYVENRQLRYEVLRVLPLDIRLPVTLLSVCTTYLIVLIQFTHLYD